MIRSRRDVGEQAGGALWPQDADGPAACAPTTTPTRCGRCSRPVRVSARTSTRACRSWPARPPPRRVRAARRSIHHSRWTPGRHRSRGERTGPWPGWPTSRSNRCCGWSKCSSPVAPPRRAAAPLAATTAGAAAGRDPVGEGRRRAIVEKAMQRPALRDRPPLRGRRAHPTQRNELPGRRGRAATSAGPRAASRIGPHPGVGCRDLHPAQPAATDEDGPPGRRRSPGGGCGAGSWPRVEELAVLAALPQDLAVPGLDRARAKAMPAPVAVPGGGRGVKVLGRAQIGGHAVGLNVADARQHVHLIGKTGAGKSTLLLNMILADVHARRGVVVIDPRGDLVTDILDRLPVEAAERIVIIDPDQAAPGVASTPWTPAGRDGTRTWPSTTSSGSSRRSSNGTGDPRIDDTLRVSCLTLMRRPNPTLLDGPPLLNDRGYRAQFTADLNDPEGLGGFWNWYDSMNDGLRAQVIGPVLARLRAFLLRDFVKTSSAPPAPPSRWATSSTAGSCCAGYRRGSSGRTPPGSSAP